MKIIILENSKTNSSITIIKQSRKNQLIFGRTVDDGYVGCYGISKIISKFLTKDCALKFCENLSAFMLTAGTLRTNRYVEEQLHYWLQ